ncbi:hypothetical protein GCM10017752_48090 [Streptomyces roseoviridis]
MTLSGSGSVCVDRAVDSLPPLPRAVTSTVYVVPGAALRSEVHEPPPEPVRPGSAAPSSSTTFTRARVPPLADTVSGRPATGGVTVTFAGVPGEAAARGGALSAVAAEQAVSDAAVRRNRGMRMRVRSTGQTSAVEPVEPEKVGWTGL